MQTTDICLCCGSTDLKLTPAPISPFILERSGEEGPRLTALGVCARCHVQQFRHRLTDSNAERVYAGYRDDNYVAQRQKHEFWYTRRLNSGLVRNPEVRRDAIARFLERSGIDLRQVSSALDFGGDSGELFPDPMAQADRWVVDPSGSEVEPGVNKAVSLEALPEAPFEFVMANQVFEHLSEPLKALGALVAKMGPHGIFYCEVPREHDYRDLQLPTPVQRAWLRQLVRSPRLFALFDFYSVGCRRKLNLVPPLGFLKLHEHQQYFTESSLRALCERAGLRVLGCESAVATAPIIQCVARKPERPPG